LTWAVVAAISSLYFFGLTPGHFFVQDDFAAYVMHAANLVDGRPDTAIEYVPNPQAPWVSPANGYPPVYPLLLAPVYRLRGLDLGAMKAVSVFTFVMFLVVFAAWSNPVLSPHMRTVAVALVGLSPAFWSYRDLIASEFPYWRDHSQSSSASLTWQLCGNRLGRHPSPMSEMRLRSKCSSFSENTRHRPTWLYSPSRVRLPFTAGVDPQVWDLRKRRTMRWISCVAPAPQF
jgi:hypothetical protein